MRFARILEAVYSRVWMITPEAHRAISRLVQTVYEREAGLLTPEDASRGTNPLTRQPLPTMQIRGGTAIIPMRGVMARGAEQIDKACGIVDVEDVRRDLDEAEASEEVERIVLDIDSPGGMHNGAMELAQRLATCTKETVAWTAGAMCSAAYFVGCSADHVWAAPSAMVGSIGSYIALLDETRAYELQGYKVELFKAGDYKGAGTPGLPLTDKQRAYIQGIVDQANEQFQSHVMAMRPDADTGVMDGRGFYSKEAFGFGLVDGQANSLNDLLKMLTPRAR